MELMTVQECADYLQIGKRAMQNHMTDPAFPRPFKVGRKFWLDKEEVNQWISKKRVERDKALLDDLAGQYAEQDGSELDADSGIIEFVTDEDMHQIDEVLSGQIGIHDADTDWLESLLAKVKDLGSVQSDTHVFGVTRAYKLSDLPTGLRGTPFKQQTFSAVEAAKASRGEGA